jgi:uncharacterized protein
MNKALVIYHANCDDGFGAAFAFWKYAAKDYDSVSYHPASYGSEPPEVDKDTSVYILDFSYHPNIIMELAEKSKLVHLLDHHKTAKEGWDSYRFDGDQFVLPSNLTIDFDMNRSGAMMMYYYVANDASCYKLFEFLQDRDLWRFQNPDTKFFTQYLRSYPQDFEVWSAIASRLNYADEYARIMEAGEALERRFNQMCQEILATNCKEIWLNGIKGLSCNAPGIFASEVGHLLADQSGSFGATWYNNRNGDIIFSLRSIGEFDVSAIAKSFGGGGHRNAAGFRITQEADAVTLNRISNIGPDQHI